MCYFLGWIGFFSSFPVLSPHSLSFLSGCQVLGPFFFLWHPSSQSREHSCRRILCCCFKRARSPTEFANAASFWMGGPIKLALLPPIFLFIVEVCHGHPHARHNKLAIGGSPIEGFSYCKRLHGPEWLTINHQPHVAVLASF